MNELPRIIPLTNVAETLELFRFWFSPEDIIHLEPLQMREPTPDDPRTTRPMPRHRMYVRMNDPQLEHRLTCYLFSCDVLKAHAFFSVSPRELADRQADMLHQSRRIIGFWADFDGTDWGTVFTRIKAVGLPDPHVAVMSGGGIHTYWKLDQEYVIDDAGQVEPIFYETKEGDKYGTPCVKLPDGTKEWLGKRKIAPSAKCQAFIDVQAGLYTLLTDKEAKFKADSVQNPNRFLRAPGSVNHKYPGEGKGTKCFIIFRNYNATRVTFAQFNELTQRAQPLGKEELEFVPEPRTKKFASLSDKMREKLSDMMISLNRMEQGGPDDRSDRAFELVCLMYEHGIKYDEALHLTAKIKVFQEHGGEKWFDRTWEAAVLKHRKEYLARIDKMQAQRADREGLGPAPTAGEPQQESPVEKLWEQRRIERAQKMCKDLRFDVVGEKADGTVLLYSHDKGKTDEIKDVGRLQIAKLNQAVGDAAASRLTTVATDAPGQYSITEARELIGLLGGKFQITNESYMGTGIWPVKDNGVLTGEVLLVNGRESSVLDPHTKVLTKLTSPRYKDLIVALDGQVESPWYDIASLQNAINLSADVNNRLWLTERLRKHFEQWKWADVALTPSILTGLLLATFVQTCWPWRPLVAILGGARAGKTLLMHQLQGVFGTLTFAATHPTEAAIRQGISNTAKVIFSDEFEASGRRAPVLELLRTSSRGDQMVRGTTHHRAQRFGLKHIPYVAAIELGLDSEADKSRFLVFEMERNPGHINQWEPVQLERVRLACLGAALYCLPEALQLARALADTHATDNADRRLVDNLAVPLAMAMAVSGASTEVASEKFVQILQAKAMELEETDEQAMLSSILGLLVDIGSGIKRTVAEVLSLADTSLDTHVEALARQYGITIVERDAKRGARPKPSAIPKEERMLFIGGRKLKDSQGFKNTRFAGQDPSQYLKRLCPEAEPGRLRVSGAQVCGVVIPMQWVEQNFMA